MKTVKEWLNELPEPYNELAITNLVSHRGEEGLSIIQNRMSYAINLFNWRSSPQGHEFWSSIHDYYEKQEQIPDLMHSMTERMLEYYKRIEDIRNAPFPDMIAEMERRRKEEEEQRIEYERQINERVMYSASFKEMLDKLADSSKVAERLHSRKHTTNLEANYISMRGEMCSFLPAGREHKTNPDTGRWLRDGRQEMKPAKLARRLLIEDRNTDLDATDYEKFANAIKSYISVIGDEDGNGKNIRFELVKGEDIRKYYHWRTYSEMMGKETNLWGSCMRSDDCQEYFDIYVKNEDVCSLLVALDGEGKVLGRALVWTFKDGKRGMDTIYANESLFESFITWAVDNQAYYKDRQSCHHQQFDRLNRGSVCYDARVQLAYYKPSYYPYMDTLSILTEYGILRTDVPSGDSYKTLRDTGGGYEEGEDDDDYVTLETGGRCHVDDCTYVDYRNHDGVYRDGYYHESAVVFTNDDSYRLRDDCVRIGSNWYELDSDDICYVDSRDEYCLREDTVYCEFDDACHHVDDCHELHDHTFAHESDCKVCAHSGDYYLIDDLTSASDGACVAKENLEEYEETIKEQLNENENETATA